MEPFTTRTALVTGAASGIGAALVRRLRSCGATVITTRVEGDVDHHLDVREADDFRAVIAEIGVPGLLFANAGISMGGPTHELTRAHWDRAIDVNLNGVVNGLLAVYPGMVERGSGHIVITASGAGLAPPSVRHRLCRHEACGRGARARSATGSGAARRCSQCAVPRRGGHADPRPSPPPRTSPPPRRIPSRHAGSWRS